MFISSLPVPLDILMFRQRAMKAKKKAQERCPKSQHLGAILVPT